jgi:hypothetical protein
MDETKPQVSAGPARATAADPVNGPKKPSRRLPMWLLRRKYLVNPRRQLRAALLVVIVTSIPIVILNFTLGYVRVLEREAIFQDVPADVERKVWLSDRNEALLFAAASLIYLMGVFAITVVDTHQTSGAALGVARHLRSIRDGRYATRLGLRNSDNLKELTEPYNQMAIALQARSIRLAEALADLAGRTAALDGGDTIAEELRDLASTESRHAGQNR